MSDTKADVVINWIGHGPLRVQFDTTREGVVVPRHLQGKIDVVFEIGLDLPISIPDLKIDEDGISATLSFGGYGLIPCFVPWAAVFGVSSIDSDAVAMWLNDAPGEIQRRILHAAGEEANKKLRRDRLKLVKG